MFPSTLQFINRFQSCPFMDRQGSLLFHQSNWTAEIRARVGTDRGLNFSHQGGATEASTVPSRNSTGRPGETPCRWSGSEIKLGSLCIPFSSLLMLSLQIRLRNSSAS